MNELENVKVGDKLLVHNRYGEDIEIVRKVTKTLVVTKYHRFRIRDGYSIPTDKWINTYAKPATPDYIERIAKIKIRVRNIQICKDTDYYKLTDSQLERIIDIIKNKD